MGTIIDFQSRRDALRGAGAADPLERLRLAVRHLDPLVRALDARSFEAGVASEVLNQIQTQLDLQRVEEAASQAEDLLRRMIGVAQKRTRRGGIGQATVSVPVIPASLWPGMEQYT